MAGLKSSLQQILATEIAMASPWRRRDDFVASPQRRRITAVSPRRCRGVAPSSLRPRCGDAQGHRQDYRHAISHLHKGFEPSDS